MSAAVTVVLILLALVVAVDVVDIVAYLGHRADEAAGHYAAGYTDGLAASPMALDLDAARAAGDRAYLAVRADQATRPPRRERARHLAAIA